MFRRQKRRGKKKTWWGEAEKTGSREGGVTQAVLLNVDLWAT